MFAQKTTFDTLKKSSNTNIQPTKQPTSQAKEVSKTADSQKNREKLYAGLGLSLVTLSTIGGILYFTKRGHARVKHLGPTTQTSELFPQYGENTTTFVYMANGAKNQTVHARPEWEALISGYAEKSYEGTLNDVSKATKKPPTEKSARHERRENEVIPGIIRQISTSIKDYMRKCGIDKTNNKVNPEALDEILTNAVGEGNVKERPYLENGIKSKGRVKEYKSPNGRVYVLEAHDSPNGVVTRLYMHDKDKHLRAYLHADGTFRLNSYTSQEAHFDTTAKGKRWMENSKFDESKPKN